MNKLTGGLIIAAVALGILAARNARRTSADKEVAQPTPPAQQPATGSRPLKDQGIIQRNEPLDNGIAVRSPFNGDPGIVSHARTNGHS